MPKRKELPKTAEFDNMGINPQNSYIQKARPLQSLAETDLTLPEFKILDAYLARINSHDPEKRTVRLEKGELEKVLGVSRILKADLDKRLRHLFQIVEIKDEKKRKGFKLINLFEEADAEQDDDGLWQISLTCTASAREYIFNIDNIGYLRYRLKNVVNLTSRYSYILFLYLIDNRFRKKWTVDLSELKKLLNCTAVSYNEYREFNKKVLKKCQTELHEKTDIRFSYKAIKKGRAVSAVEFTVETFSDELTASPAPSLYDGQLEGQMSIFDVSDLSPDDGEYREEVDYGSDFANLLGQTCFDEFSPEQIRVLQDLLLEIVGHDDMACSDYLSHKLHVLNLYEKEKIKKGEKINSRFAYLRGMLEKDVAANQRGSSERNKGTNDGGHHSFDIDEVARFGILTED